MNPQKAQTQTPGPGAGGDKNARIVAHFKQYMEAQEKREKLINNLKGRTRLIEVELTNIAWNLKYVNEAIDNEDLAESIMDLIAELHALINEATDKAGHLKNVLKWDGQK
jgi:hypothetical protein